MTLRRVLLALLIVFVAVVRSDAEKVSLESSSCASTQTSGSGEKLISTCVTDTGNVAKFVTPSGVENLHIDGYAICDDESGGLFGARAYNALGTDFGFSVPTTHTSTSNVRKTADGRYTLTQSFARDVTEKQLIITMTLKNNGPGQATDVILQRAVDIDAGGHANDNIFHHSIDSIIATGGCSQPCNGKGMMVGVLTPEIFHNIGVLSYVDYSTQSFDDCAQNFTVLPPTPPGDYVGLVRFELGNLAAGAAKTMKIFYQRF